MRNVDPEEVASRRERHPRRLAPFVVEEDDDQATAQDDDGLVLRRIEVATLLEAGKSNKHFGWAVNWLTTRLRSGWDNAMGVSAYDVRRLMREAALGSDASRRDMAFRGFKVLLDRGSLHSLRRQTRVTEASERARHELMELSGGNSGGTR